MQYDVDGVGKENLIDTSSVNISNGNRVIFLLKDGSKIIVDVFNSSLKVEASVEGAEKRNIDVIQIDNTGRYSKEVVFKRKNGTSFKVNINV